MATRKKKAPTRTKAPRRPAAAKKAKPAARGTAPKSPVEIHFRGALAVERDRGGATRVHVLSSAAEAEAFGLAGEFVAELFKGGRRRARRDAGDSGPHGNDPGDVDPNAPPGLCATVGGFGPGGFFIYCRDLSCTSGGGDDCWMYSRNKDGSDERRGADNPPKAGRVYYCTCVYFG
jgi:hypothetical protein